MKIPVDAIVPSEKLTRYWLVPKARNDKSAFLAQAGFTQANPEILLAAIRDLAAQAEALEDNANEYGVFYQVIGHLMGINGVSLAVVTIWLERRVDSKFQFITLKPYRGPKDDA